MNLFKSLCAQLLQLSKQQPQGYLSVEQSCEKTSLLLWLKAQQSAVKIYWRDKDDANEVAMLGICHQIDHLSDDTRISEARYFGGIGFDQQSSNWPAFGHHKFVLPRIEFRRNGHHFSLVCHLDCRTKSVMDEVQACIALIEQLQPSAPRLKNTLTNPLKQRVDIPDKANWCHLVDKALAQEQQGDFAKVVLSRESTLDFEQSVNPWDLLYQWNALNNNCYQFAFQFSPEQTFIGCSPERLYLRSGSRLTSEALAGTILRGKNEQEDLALANKLQLDPKLKRENTLVLKDILSRMAEHCLDIGVDDISVLKLDRIQHLKQRIHAFLQAEVNDETLLGALHPTPAVGGAPREQALAFILEHEPYQRGWYAGAVGYISAMQSEFSVAIRSALIQSNKVKLYAGAGLVKGSLSELEWQELDNKISTVLALLCQEASK